MPSSRWLLLILTIPGRQPALRMRVWRRLKTLGIGVLRDGVYLAPNQQDLRTVLQEQAREVIDATGAAQLLEVDVPEADFGALFDRSQEYRRLIANASTTAKAAKRARADQTVRSTERLRREFEAIVSRDFFPGPLQQQARAAVDHLRDLAERLLTPDEPHAAQRRIRKLNRADYQGRVWATRQHPWVDRLASAWLIQRFIDLKARFRWLKRPTLKLGKALGFDFDGADFTHVDDKVTFEVLVHSFGLENDESLQKLGAIVHYLDRGGLPVPEAAAVEALLRGIRQRTSNDDRFLAEASALFDDLYAGLASEVSNT